jgi:hypothetical protein
MLYKFYLFFIIIPISYNMCWKCPPLRSSQRCTRRIMLANTFCNVPVDILSTVRWLLAWSSCSVCGWFEYTVSLRYPHRKKSGGGGLSPGIVKATISLKWGVQETDFKYAVGCVTFLTPCICDHRKREAKGPSWIINASKWMNEWIITVETSTVNVEG